MCGIAGSVNLSLDQEILDMISHRGPDDSGLQSFDINDNRVTFGHRRLSIVDLSPSGHQPMSSHDGRFHIVFNGEIYNHAELKQELGDFVFKGHSDTETIINYISRFGISSVKKFNGIFSLAVLDTLKAKLFLVRDRFGVKPMYYTMANDSLAFCSEIRPLLKLCPSEFDTDNLALLLRLRYNPSPSTLFKNIFKLRPGHLLEYDLMTNGSAISSFLEPVKINHHLSYKDALDQYGELFEEAVKSQLMSDVDVGVLLSGGIDSALVAFYAQKHYQKKLQTFTVGFSEESEANEIVEAKETADFIGAEHKHVLISSADFDDTLKKIVESVEEPLGTSSVIPMYFLNKLVSDNKIKVVLTGQGADESLGGYPRYQGELVRHRIPGFAFDLLKHSGIKIKNKRISRAIYSLGENDPVKRFDKIYALFSEEEIYRLIGKKDKQSVPFIRYYYELLKGDTKRPVEAMMANDLHMNLSDDLLLYGDKISMHFAIEARVPLLDNKLVQFIESLPYQYRLKSGKGKIIHKDFAEKVLPHSIVHRTKKGFQSPTEKWFKGEIGKKYYDLLTQENSQFATYFDVKEVKKILDIHIQGKANKETQLFTLISVYNWMNSFLK